MHQAGDRVILQHADGVPSEVELVPPATAVPEVAPLPEPVCPQGIPTQPGALPEELPPGVSALDAYLEHAQCRKREVRHDQGDEGLGFVGVQAGGEGNFTTGRDPQRSTAVGGSDSRMSGGGPFTAGCDAAVGHLAAPLLPVGRRALEGLVTALGPRPRGKQPSLELRVKQLEKELEAARRAWPRQEALVRVTQRSMGLAALAKPKPPAPVINGKRRKSRRPMVRALKACERTGAGRR